MNGKNKLKNIIESEPYMKILIDNRVQTDSENNFLINIGYTRVSTDRQAEAGYGLDIQEKDIMNYCIRNEMDNLLLFTDDGYTGTNMDRPALKRIIEMIQAFNEGRTNIRINTMIIPKIDRLGRTLLGTLQFIQDYIVAGADSKNSTVNKNREDINFISVAENYCRIERNNPQGKFLLMLFASLAEFDRDLIVEKLKKGRAARAASGKWMGGGLAPYGYQYDKEQGVLKIIPEQAEKVREVFRLYIDEKMSPAKIAGLLGFKGERIVVQIIKRKSLTGCLIHKGQEYEGAHEPIISAERWLEAQEEMKKRSVIRGDPHYMLSGLIYCGECGAKMRYQKWDKSTGECKIVCYSHQKSRPSLVKDENCDNQLFWQSDIEQAVISELFKMTYLGEESNVKQERLIDTAAALKTQLEAESKKLSRLYDFNDDENDDILREKIAESRNKIKSLQAQIDNEQEQEKLKKKIVKTRKILKTLKDAWGYMDGKEKQTVCRELIDSVVIYKNCTIDLNLKLKSYLIKNQ